MSAQDGALSDEVLRLIGDDEHSLCVTLDGAGWARERVTWALGYRAQPGIALMARELLALRAERAALLAAVRELVMAESDEKQAMVRWEDESRFPARTLDVGGRLANAKAKYRVARERRDAALRALVAAQGQGGER